MVAPIGESWCLGKRLFRQRLERIEKYDRVYSSTSIIIVIVVDALTMITNGKTNYHHTTRRTFVRTYKRYVSWAEKLAGRKLHNCIKKTMCRP